MLLCMEPGALSSLVWQQSAPCSRRHTLMGLFACTPLAATSSVNSYALRIRSTGFLCDSQNRTLGCLALH